MGVRGLTTFIANRSSQYLERYELHDTYLVIDGNSIACQLYKWHCRCNDCFGGDYDKYANVIYSFFQLLSDCNITPLIIFDGAYEKRKMKTVFSRMRNKISAAKDLNSVTEGRVSLFPLFLRELFIDIVLELNLQCVRCDFEGDSDAAHLARTLQCPLLSYDSDFYIFDVLYIPFSTMELKVRKKKDVRYISCEVYRVEKFLRSFGGLDKVNLPLLAVLLGNDYIKKRVFSRFYRQLKIQKTKQNEQQTQIKSVIVWLKNETPDSALRKILGRYKLRYRKRIARKIQKAIEGYQFGNTPVCSYFNIEETFQEDEAISVPNPEDIENLEDEENGVDSHDDDDEDDKEEGSSIEEEGEGEKEDEEDKENEIQDEEDKAVKNKSKVFQKSYIPDFFRENFRKGLYPSCFMDIIASNSYFCIQQIENCSTEQSHRISFDIIAAIHKILTFPRTRKLKCMTRHYSNVKKNFLPLYEKDIPTLVEIENLDTKIRKTTLCQILNLQDDMFNMFPDSWHLFLMSIKYWVTNSKNKVDFPYIYAIILCSIVLNYVDKKIGFYRSTKSFFSKYSATSQSASKPSSSKDIIECLDDIDLDNSVACMKKLIHYFQMEAKMKSYVKLFDKNIVHGLAEFQSCLLHIKYLNSLLNYPFPSIIVSEFYDGTFIYNMTTNLQKRSDLKAYMKILLEDCPKILNVFELIIEQVEVEIENVEKHEPVKKRKKKKKVVENVVPEILKAASEDEEEYVLDENNKFSLLSFINK